MCCDIMSPISNGPEEVLINQNPKREMEENRRSVVISILRLELVICKYYLYYPLSNTHPEGTKVIGNSRQQS